MFINGIGVNYQMAESDETIRKLFGGSMEAKKILVSQFFVQEFHEDTISPRLGIRTVDGSEYLLTFVTGNGGDIILSKTKEGK